MARRKRVKAGRHEIGIHDGAGSLRWLLTYADMITLLMAFFIMLYSMSILNTGKFNQVAISIKSGFGGMVHGSLPAVQQNKAEQAKADKDYNDMIRDLQAVMHTHNMGKVMRLREEERGIVISLSTDNILFGKASVELSPRAEGILSPIADVLRRVPNQMRVEGHTCDLRVRSDIYPSNWELSSARAGSVVRFLIERKGMNPDRLSVSGYASYRPIVPNSSESNREQNRRVDIVVIRTVTS